MKMKPKDIKKDRSGSGEKGKMHAGKRDIRC